MLLFHLLLSFIVSKDITVVGERFRSVNLTENSKLTLMSKDNQMIVALFSENIRNLISIKLTNNVKSLTIDKFNKITYGFITLDNTVDIEVKDPSLTVSVNIWMIPKTACYLNSYIVSNEKQFELSVQSISQKTDICLFIASDSYNSHLKYGFLQGEGTIELEKQDGKEIITCNTSQCDYEPGNNVFLHYMSQKSSGFYLNRDLKVKEQQFTDCQFTHLVSISAEKGIEKTFPLIGEDPKLECHQSYYSIDFITSSSLFSIIVQILIFFVSPALLLLFFVMFICLSFIPKRYNKQSIDTSLHPEDDIFQTTLIDDFSDENEFEN